MNHASYHRASAAPFLSSEAADLDFSSPDPSSSGTSFSTDFSLSSSGSHPQTPFSASFTAQPGSYQNSPLGSDISHLQDLQPGSSPNPGSHSPYDPVVNDDFSFDIPVFPPDEYDPNDYDAQGSSLLFTTDFISSLDSAQSNPPQHPSSPTPSASSVGSDNPGVSVSVIPAEGIHSYGSPNYQGSPASSTGGDDFRLNSLQQRSRASSIASSHKASNSLDYSTLGMEHVNLDSSSWMGQNAQTPPHIVIPDNGSSRQGQASPMLGSNNLASLGAGMMPPHNRQLDLGGPGIQVVPATPISAGNGNVAHGGINAFSHLMRQQQGRSPPSVPSALSMSQTPSWSQQHPLSDSRVSSPMPNQQSYANTILTPPTSAGSQLNNDILGDFQAGLSGRNDTSSSAFPSDSVDDSNFLVPISNSRSRSKSENNMQRPSWGTNGFDQSSISVTHEPPPQMQTPHLTHLPASYGPPANDSLSSFGNATNLLSGSINNNNFLSPDHALTGIGATDLRRARSEGHGHKRNALSADMAPIYADQASANDLLYPSQAGFRFGSGAQQGPSGGYLTAGMGASQPSAAGAHRRTMSGGSAHGHSRSLSRDRASLGSSPYPSPHASPRTNTQALPDPYASSYGASAPSVHVMSHDAQGRPTVQSQQPIQVARQSVTTHATADASMKRRRTDATFICPVIGCGSTFTRHFNLKGHMRSHNEERPFKCKWPGCEKGFARQHDCKRHENLHLNIRPYTCNGCQRTFARMDALNRHLRSEAGTECQAKQPMLTSEDAKAVKDEDGAKSEEEWQPLPLMNGVVV